MASLSFGLATSSRRATIKGYEMGEAKRRKAFEGRLWREPLPGNDAAALIGSVLGNLADLLDCMVLLKEAEDGLLDWPIASIIGQTLNPDKARGCPFVEEIRKSPGGWEFLIDDKFLVAAYTTDAMKRGLSYPGPIEPLSFPDRLRQWFSSGLTAKDGWKAVLPSAPYNDISERPRNGVN
jgi:hypothetical protein